MTTINNQVGSKNKILGAFNLCLVVMFLVGGFYFLKSMDDVMVKNLELEQLKSQLTSLENKNSELESSKNKLESYESVSSRLKNLSMVKVIDIKYINTAKDSLAKK
jgi:Tfp pilus assembly protein PilO